MKIIILFIVLALLNALLMILSVNSNSKAGRAGKIDIISLTYLANTITYFCLLGRCF